MEDLIPLVGAMIEHYPLVRAWQSGFAYIYRELGRHDEEREQLEVLVGRQLCSAPDPFASPSEPPVPVVREGEERPTDKLLRFLNGVAAPRLPGPWNWR
jgi:hypothetical protein